MEIYQALDLFIKLTSALVAGVGAYTIFWKHQQEKNRNIYEKRLNDVYAPLYGYLVRQETERKIRWPQSEDFEDVPILEPNLFCKELAKPKLLKLLYQYQMLVEGKKFSDVNNDEELKDNRDMNEGVVALELIDEIINGYTETLKSLGIDRRDETDSALKDFNFPEW